MIEPPPVSQAENEAFQIINKRIEGLDLSKIVNPWRASWVGLDQNSPPEPQPLGGKTPTPPIRCLQTLGDGFGDAFTHARPCPSCSGRSAPYGGSSKGIVILIL